jgi:DNA invertase Pin-like site-specific DNA recombinase
VNELPAFVIRYCAKSTEDTNDSITRQLSTIDTYIRDQGWEPYREPFSDIDKSAYHGSRGSGLVEAQRAAEQAVHSGRTVYLLVAVHDRLARGAGDETAAHLCDRLSEARRGGYHLHSVAEGDKLDEYSWCGMLGDRSHSDSASKAFHTSGGMRRTAERGEHLGGKRSYGLAVRHIGYDEKRRKAIRETVIVPEEAAVVVRVFQEAAAGREQSQIALSLNEDGIRPRKAASWSQGRISQLLRDQNYIGMVQWRSEWSQGKQPRIVDESLWNAVQARLASRRVSRGGRTALAPFLLGGSMLRCHRCGYPMRTRSVPRANGKVDEYYDCTGRSAGRANCPQRFVRRSDVDPEVLGWFEEFGLDLEAMREQVISAGSAELERIRAELKAAQREKTSVADALGRVREDYRAGRLDNDPERNAALWREERADLEQQLEAARAAAERLHTHEAEARRAIDATAADQAVLERLARLRKAVAGAVSGAEDIKAARRALSDVFEYFIWHEGDGWAYIEPVPREDAAVLFRLGDGAQVAEYRPTALPPMREAIAPGSSSGAPRRVRARVRRPSVPA